MKISTMLLIAGGAWFLLGRKGGTGAWRAAFPSAYVVTPTLLGAYSGPLAAKAQQLGAQYDVPVKWLLGAGVPLEHLEVFAVALQAAMNSLVGQAGASLASLDVEKARATVSAIARNAVAAQTGAPKAVVPAPVAGAAAPSDTDLEGCSCSHMSGIRG